MQAGRPAGSRVFVLFAAIAAPVLTQYAPVLELPLAVYLPDPQLMQSVAWLL
jgi:hypothetical protein